MKKIVLSAAIAAALAVPAVGAFAEDAPPASPLSFNVGVVSDYLFRGISQTHGDPALQGGIDYAFSNGFYIGTWASNISWVKDYTGKGTTEIDLYGGYRGTFATDFTYDVGAIAYTYPGHGAANNFGANPTTEEVYGSVGYKDFSVKYSHVVSSHFVGWIGTTSDGNTRNSNYIEANYAHDLGDGWGVSAHVGHQKVKNFSPASYTDWKLGVTKDVGFGVLGLAYSDTNAKGSCSPVQEAYCWGNQNFVSPNGATSGFQNVSKGKAVLSFLKTF